MGAEVRLREFREEDLPFLDRLGQDPAATGVFEWGGFRDSRSRRRRFELDGYVSAESVGLAITLADDAEAGPVGLAGTAAPVIRPVSATRSGSGCCPSTEGTASAQPPTTRW